MFFCSIISKVLYKDLQRRKVEEVPEGLSRATIRNSFHSHDLKIRSLYTWSRIMDSSSVGLNSTKSSSLNPKSNDTIAFTLTSLKDGIGAVIEVGLRLEIVSLDDSGSVGGRR
ncbi:hypothetical protein ETB97_006432 [Aspergillus alliaceus]|uniref:Uncharacterized protein n=1 Tax=Petromyces alliaceus TaxID=209559 RepID=A0A8H5ZXR1_PETAA|nr:hypothetical protein ETB97_006432 [Aspergillus burnettii]